MYAARNGEPKPSSGADPSPWWLLLLLYLLSALFLGLLARQIPGPLDIDGAYYLLVARSLAQGRGLVVDALWHFFQPAAQWPQPAGDLWMPLPSLLMVPALRLGNTFRHAQLAQVLLAALLPLLSFRIARSEGASPVWAGLAALITLLGGTVTVHWLDSDCYTAYAVFGGAALYAMGQSRRDNRWLVLAGLLGGLVALTRNDGLLMLVVFWIYVLWNSRGQQRRVPWRQLLLGTALFLLPVLLWWLRNWLTFGQPSPVSLSFLMSMHDYHQLLAYQPHPDWAGFWRQGWSTFWGLRRDAFNASLVVFIGDMQAWGLLPLAVVMARLRQRPALWPVFLYLLLLWLALLGLFPLLVLHGTWSRSLNAFLPAGYACMALGLQDTVHAIHRWRPALPARLLQGTFLFLGIAATILVGGLAMLQQLQAVQPHPQAWQRIGDWLRENSRPDEVIMAQDPMAVLLYADRRAIGIPYADTPQLIEIARSYGVTKLALIEKPGQGLPETLQQYYADHPAQGSFALLWHQKESWIYGLDD